MGAARTDASPIWPSIVLKSADALVERGLVPLCTANGQQSREWERAAIGSLADLLKYDESMGGNDRVYLTFINGQYRSAVADVRASVECGAAVEDLPPPSGQQRGPAKALAVQTGMSESSPHGFPEDFASEASEHCQQPIHRATGRRVEKKSIDIRMAPDNSKLSGCQKQPWHRAGALCLASLQKHSLIDSLGVFGRVGEGMEARFGPHHLCRPERSSLPAA